jgi:hypothetical protein
MPASHVAMTAPVAAPPLLDRPRPSHPGEGLNSAHKRDRRSAWHSATRAISASTGDGTSICASVSAARPMHDPGLGVTVEFAGRHGFRAERTAWPEAARLGIGATSGVGRRRLIRVCGGTAEKSRRLARNSKLETTATSMSFGNPELAAAISRDAASRAVCRCPTKGTDK